MGNVKLLGKMLIILSFPRGSMGMRGNASHSPRGLREWEEGNKETGNQELNRLGGMGGKKGYEPPSSPSRVHILKTTHFSVNLKLCVDLSCWVI